jgi:hypothetical protein
MFALQSPSELTTMLIPFLHRRRKAAEAKAKFEAGVHSAVEQTRQIYGTRLLVRGLLWGSVYLLAHGLLMNKMHPVLRVLVAMMPVPFFVWYLWTWMKGVAAMDELQRRIELEALGFAFPATLVWLMTIGLLDLAVPLDTEAFSGHHVWLMMPVLYYVGLWRAKQRYS